MEGMDSYRTMIWLQDYIREAKSTAETLTEEAKRLDPQMPMFEDMLDCILAMRNSINKATRALWDLEKAEGVEDFYDDCGI